MADTLGIKSTPPGIDVLKSNARELSFSSSFEMHKIKKQGENQPQTAFEVYHGLHYWPFFLHFRDTQRTAGQASRDNLKTGHATLFTYYYIFHERSFI